MTGSELPVMTGSELPRRENKGSGIRCWSPGVEDGLTEDGIGRRAMGNSTLLSYFNWKALLLQIELIFMQYEE